MKNTIALALILLFQIQANAQDAIRAAYEQLHQGDVNGAYREFRALSDRDPQSLAASFGVLVALYERGLEDQPLQNEFEQRIDKLIEAASDRYEQNKRDTDALFYLEQAYLNRARYRADFDKGMWGAARDGIKAKNYGDEYIKVNPTRADGYFAVGLYNYYIEILPTFFKFIRTFLFMPGGNRAEGLKQIERTAAGGEPAAPFAQDILVDVYSTENRFADAVRVAENLHKTYPENASFRFGVAGIYSHAQVENFDGAVQQYTAIIQRVQQKHPNYKPEHHHQATLNLAWLRAQQFRYDEAIALLNPTIESNVEKPDWIMPNFLLARANFRVRTGDARYLDDDRRVLAQAKWKKWHKDAQEQIKVYQQRRQSGEATVFTELIPGNRLVVERRWDEAQQELEKVRARRPEDWQIRYRLAHLEFARGDYDRAYVAFSQIVNNNLPKVSNWIKANALLHLARVFDIRGQREQAVKLYKRVVDEYEDEDAADNARFGLLTRYSPRKVS
jgi:tetratricopeptide (TPR) repeat protein